MTIGSLLFQLGFKIDDAALDALGGKLDTLTAKAKGLAEAVGGVKMSAGRSGGGGGGGSGGTPAGTPTTPAAQATAGQQANNHVLLWQWQQRQVAANSVQANSHVQLFRWQQQQAAAESAALRHQIVWLRRLTEVSTKVATGLAALNVGMGAIVEMSRRSAVGLTKFGLQTGLDPVMLQRFQAVGAQRDVPKEEIADALSSLNQMRTLASWGKGDIGALNALNLNPQQSPFQMLLELSKKGSAFSRMDAGNQQMWLGRLGLSPNIQQMLARPGFADALSKTSAGPLLDSTAQKKLMNLDAAFQSFTIHLSTFASKVGATLAPVFTWLTEHADHAISVLSRWIDRLNGPGADMRVFRYALYGIAAGLVAITAAVATLAATSGWITLMTVIRSLGLGGGIGGLLGGAGSIGGGGALAGTAGILLQVLTKIPMVLAAVAAVMGGYLLGKEGFKFLTDKPSDYFLNNSDPSFRAAHSSSVQTNNLHVTVNGSNPENVVSVLEKWYSGKLRVAASNMPQFSPP